MRFYLGQDIAAPVSPAYSGTWDDTAWASRRGMTQSKGAESVPTIVSAAVGGGAAPWKSLIRQYVSDALSAGEISGVAMGQFACSEAYDTDDLSSAVIIRVVSSDGGTVRGTLLESIPGALVSEFPSGADYVNRHYPPSATLTPVTAESGDRLVVEIGVVLFGSSVNPQANLMVFSADTVDLPIDETTVNPNSGLALNSWVYLGPPIVDSTGIASAETFGGQTVKGATSFYGQRASGGFGFLGAGVFSQLTPTVKILTGSGGFKMGGVGVVDTLLPDTQAALGQGGYRFGGLDLSGYPTTTYPVTTTSTGKGGLKLGGGGAWYVPDPGDIPTLLITGKGGLKFGGAGTFAITLPPKTLLVGSGGFQFGGFRLAFDKPLPALVDLYRDVSEPAVFAFGGAGLWYIPTATTLIVTPSKGVFALGGAGVVTGWLPPVFLITGGGGFCLSGTGLEAPGVDTWVLTGNSFEPSLYVNYGFESFAKLGNQFYGIKDDGIYLLSGEDDDGVKIIPAIRVGPLNLGNLNFKRLRALNIGDYIPDAPESRVRVEAITREGLPNLEGIVSVQGGRFTIPYTLQARSFILDIAGFKKLSQFEITALTLIFD